MKTIKENLQTSVLFDDTLSYINTSSNNSNIVHKRCATSANNFSVIPLKKDFNRSEDNPLLVNRCHVTDDIYADRTLFVFDRNIIDDCIIFVNKDYDYFNKYVNDYKDFSIFNTSRIHTSMHTA
jgi:hypothetical protein